MRTTKIALHQLIQYRDQQIASKSLSRKLGIQLPFVAYAMAAGESISSEQSDRTKLVQVLDGTLTVRLTDHDEKMTRGELLVIPAGTAHSYVAEERCQFTQMETK